MYAYLHLLANRRRKPYLRQSTITPSLSGATVQEHLTITERPAASRDRSQTGRNAGVRPAGQVRPVGPKRPAASAASGSTDNKKGPRSRRLTGRSQPTCLAPSSYGLMCALGEEETVIPILVQIEIASTLLSKGPSGNDEGRTPSFPITWAFLCPPCWKSTTLTASFPWPGTGRICSPKPPGRPFSSRSPGCGPTGGTSARGKNSACWSPRATGGKGDCPHLCEAPGGRAPTEGWSRQMGTVPFSAAAACGGATTPRGPRGRATCSLAYTLARQLRPPLRPRTQILRLARWWQGRRTDFLIRPAQRTD